MGVNQGSQFRFHCSEFRFFDQSLTFILLNLKPKSQTFRTEIRIPVFTENEKNHRNFGLSDRNGEPWRQLVMHAACGSSQQSDPALPRETFLCFPRRKGPFQ